MIAVELEIEALVLHGLDAAQAEAFVAALRDELAAGLLPAPVRSALLARGQVDLPGCARPMIHTGAAEPFQLSRSTARMVIQEVIR